mmetsp:Transcript_24618/g.71001  ORF Transcript_24618/g.71001 Transcript_24618/m.71001 type:complete len:281 (+) Transcript_24618:293-1135(+)
MLYKLHKVTGEAMRMVLQGTCRWTFQRFEGHPHPMVRRASVFRLYSRPHPRHQDRTMGKGGVDRPRLHAGRRTLMLHHGTTTTTTLMILTVLIATRTRTRTQMIPLYRAWDICRCPNRQRQQLGRRSQDFTGSNYMALRPHGHLHQGQCPICWPGLAHQQRRPSKGKRITRRKAAGVPPELLPRSHAFRRGRNLLAVRCLGLLPCCLTDLDVSCIQVLLLDMALVVEPLQLSMLWQPRAKMPECTLPRKAAPSPMIILRHLGPQTKRRPATMERCGPSIV